MHLHIWRRKTCVISNMTILSAYLVSCHYLEKVHEIKMFVAEWHFQYWPTYATYFLNMSIWITQYIANLHHLIPTILYASYIHHLPYQNMSKLTPIHVGLQGKYYSLYAIGFIGAIMPYPLNLEAIHHTYYTQRCALL